MKSFKNATEQHAAEQRKKMLMGHGALASLRSQPLFAQCLNLHFITLESLAILKSNFTSSLCKQLATRSL